MSYIKIVVLPLLVLFLLVASSTSNGVVRAHDNHAPNNVVGTWYLSLANGLRAFYTYHENGTMTGDTSFSFGGPPFTPEGPVTRSADQGLWARRGQPARRRFESSIYRFNYDLQTGDALNIARIRAEFQLDRHSKHAEGEFFVTMWFCPTPVECPDPSQTVPDVPEFAPPDNGFTMSRLEIR